MSLRNHSGSAVHHTAGLTEPTPQGGPGRIWRLQYGPCWCYGQPGESGSFDFVRTSSSEAAVGHLDFNVLILSDRVIDGSRPVFLQIYERVPGPKLVVAAASCPAATSFWDALPVGWTHVEELIPVDLRVDDCIGGRPEGLMAAVISRALSQPTSNQPIHAMPLRQAGPAERDAMAH